MVRNPSSPPSPLHTSAPHQASHTTQIPKRGSMTFFFKKKEEYATEGIRRWQEPLARRGEEPAKQGQPDLPRHQEGRTHTGTTCHKDAHPHTLPNKKTKKTRPG